jgi:hypothetical protein
MAGDEEDLQPVFADIDGGPRLEMTHFPAVMVEGQVPHQAAGRGEVEDALLERVDLRPEAVGFGDEKVPEDMVQMAVRVEEPDGIQPFGVYVRSEGVPLVLRIAAGVDDGAATPVVVNQIGVLLQGVERKNFNMEHLNLPMALNH